MSSLSTLSTSRSFEMFYHPITLLHNCHNEHKLYLIITLMIIIRGLSVFLPWLLLSGLSELSFVSVTIM